MVLKCLEGLTYDEFSNDPKYIAPAIKEILTDIGHRKGLFGERKWASVPAYRLRTDQIGITRLQNIDRKDLPAVQVTYGPWPDAWDKDYTPPVQ